MISGNKSKQFGGFADTARIGGQRRDHAATEASVSPGRWIGSLIFWIVVAGLVFARVALFGQT